MDVGVAGENGAMSRTDGRDRQVSGVSVDDRGTGILHVDMDAFYAAVAILDEPSLRGKPVIVASLEGRSVVSSASYEARAYGVRSAMPAARAKQLCPQGIFVSVDFARCREISSRVMQLFQEVTPLVEQLSIDEAFLDVRGAGRLWGSPREIAEMIRRRVLEEERLACSVGVASTKHVAKMASTLAKPDGYLVVPASETTAFLWGRSVRAMWGIGPKAAESLENRAIRTIGDIAHAPMPVLEKALGRASASRVYELAWGRDARAVETERVEKSISHEHTYAVDVADVTELRRTLLLLADRVAARLREGDWLSRGVSIKVRYDDFRTITRSMTLSEASSVGQRLAEAAVELFDGAFNGQPVRLLGVRADRLIPSEQWGGGLWDDDQEWRRIDAALDDARLRFGQGAVRRGSHLNVGTSRHPEEGRVNYRD